MHTSIDSIDTYINFYYVHNIAIRLTGGCLLCRCSYSPYGLEGKATAFLWPAGLLWLPENARNPKYSYLQALLNIKHAICTWGIVKSFKHRPI